MLKIIDSFVKLNLAVHNQSFLYRQYHLIHNADVFKKSFITVVYVNITRGSVIDVLFFGNT